MVLGGPTGIAELEAEVADLRRRLGMNSANSSKPPSADALDKPKPRLGLSDGSGRRRGKQPRARGVTRRLVDNPGSDAGAPATGGR